MAMSDDLQAQWDALVSAMHAEAQYNATLIGIGANAFSSLVTGTESMTGMEIADIQEFFTNTMFDYLGQLVTHARKMVADGDFGQAGVTLERVLHMMASHDEMNRIMAGLGYAVTARAFTRRIGITIKAVKALVVAVGCCIFCMGRRVRNLTRVPDAGLVESLTKQAASSGNALAESTTTAAVSRRPRQLDAKDTAFIIDTLAEVKTLLRDGRSS